MRIKKGYDRRRSQNRYEYDERGPCGCHLGPGLCRAVDARTKADFIAYSREAQNTAESVFMKTVREFDEAYKLLDSKGEPINLSLVPERSVKPVPKTQILMPPAPT